MTPHELDALILSHCRSKPRKIAMIAGLVLLDVPVPRPPGVDDLSVAARVRRLVGAGKLIGDGDLEDMGRGEVALPPPIGTTGGVGS